jgi:hypothetical protein
MLVPTSKSLAGIPAPPMFPTLDHFKCYKIAYAKTRVPAVKLDDQLGTITVDVKKPLHVCVAARQERRRHSEPRPSGDVLPRADHERHAAAAKASPEHALHEPAIRRVCARSVWPA